MGVVTVGSGAPVSLFAPGGSGAGLEQRMGYGSLVAGSLVGFSYGESGFFDSSVRREAERDVLEVVGLAGEVGASQAIGFSRGARAVVGALASSPGCFSRVALVMPPGGRAVGEYREWLDSGPTPGADVLVIGHRGDRGHPVRVAEAWAERLGARLEVLPSGAVRTDRERVAGLLGGFLSS